MVTYFRYIFFFNLSEQNTMEEFGREPCPMRILEDLGGAFAMGLIGGGVFQGIKGFRNAPTGFNRRFYVS